MSRIHFSYDIVLAPRLEQKFDNNPLKTEQVGETQKPIIAGKIRFTVNVR